jgi:hypothetical protein
LNGQPHQVQNVHTRWTGRLCCGESDDWDPAWDSTANEGTGEFYNDDDRLWTATNSETTSYPGACFNNWYQQNNSFLKLYKDDGTYKQLDEVLIWHGTFQGCAIDHQDAIDNKQDPSWDNPDGFYPETIACAEPQEQSNRMFLKPYDGTVKGSNLDDYGFDETNNNFLIDDLIHHPTPGQYTTGTATLVFDNEYCNIKETTVGSYFCSYQEKWIANTVDGNRTHLSFIPWKNATVQQAECCLPSQCWDGDECVDSILESPISNVEPWEDRYQNSRRDRGDGFICKDGNWEFSYLKTTWDGSDDGYCLNNSQCLVDPNGEYSLTHKYGPLHYAYDTLRDDVSVPACINDGEYFLDHYCENGTWTTRTKYLAADLYNQVSSAKYLVRVVHVPFSQ